MVMLNCPDEDNGVTVDLNGTARTVGGAIATSMYSTILTNKVQDVLPRNVASRTTPWIPADEPQALDFGSRERISRSYSSSAWRDVTDLGCGNSSSKAVIFSWIQVSHTYRSFLSNILTAC
jgi:hypothetical protein